MSAKEMFEKLGYKFISENDEQITYYNEGKIGLNKYEHKNTKPHLLYGTDKQIEFYKDTKSYQIFSQQLADDYEFCSMCVDIYELQAINKQVEELGWNE